MMTVFKSIVRSEEHPVGPMTVNRVMPQRELTQVGAWVFLDHFDHQLNPEDIPKPDGSFAHPHRGIATLSYLLEGEMTHLDSRAHQGKVGPGGVQWMKAGNGIVHDEWPTPTNHRLHGAQFWLNLTAKGKASEPDYRCVQATDLPQRLISPNGSFLKVVVGDYDGMASIIPTESRQVLMHLHLKSGDTFSIDLKSDEQYAAFVLSGEVVFSGETLNTQQQGYFNDGLKGVRLEATQDSDVFLYGGEPYQESVVSGGPFIMNTEAELMEAYRDYQTGQYGQINYEQIR